MKTYSYKNYSALVWYILFGILSVMLQCMDYATSDNSDKAQVAAEFAWLAIPVYLIGLLLVWLTCEAFIVLRRD